MLVPGIELPYSAIDHLVEGGYLERWDDESPERIADAVTRVLLENLC